MNNNATQIPTNKQLISLEVDELSNLVNSLQKLQTKICGNAMLMQHQSPNLDNEQIYLLIQATEKADAFSKKKVKLQSLLELVNAELRTNYTC